MREGIITYFVARVSLFLSREIEAEFHEWLFARLTQCLLALHYS